MKRVFALLLVLILLYPAALADTVRENLGAPEHITGEFQSPSGRTHIYVDADVRIPDVVCFNTYQVTARTFTLEEAKQGADLNFGSGHYMDANTGTAELILDQQQGENGLVSSCDVLALAEEGLDPLHELTITSEKTMVAGADYYRANWFEIYHENGGRSGNPGSEDHAREIADTFVAALWPEMAYYGTDPDQSDGLRGRVQGQTGYRFYYARPVDGVFITPVFQEGAYERLLNWEASSFSLPMPYEKLYVDVDAEGILGLRYDFPIESPILEEENVPVLSFAEIWRIFGVISPMTIMNYEQYAAAVNNALYIDRIELGYMAVQRKDKPARYQLIPVWDFFGKRTIKDETYDQFNNALLTINSIDGTVIDRNYGY